MNDSIIDNRLNLNLIKILYGLPSKYKKNITLNYIDFHDIQMLKKKNLHLNLNLKFPLVK